MPKYLKQDCEQGYIEDVAEIEYLKLSNLRHSVTGFMLGDFDESGTYRVAPNICAELIKIKKYLVDTIDNIDICNSAIVLNKPISFAVTFERDKATLSLIEKIGYHGNHKLNGGSYSNINEFILDEVQTSGTVDKNKIYKMWNIDVTPGESLDVFNMDEETLLIYAGIVGRFKRAMMANVMLLENNPELEAIEAEYFVNIMQALSANPELKKAVIKEFNDVLNEKKEFVRLDKPNSIKTLNELLKDTINNNIGLLKDNELEQFKADTHNALVTYNTKMQNKLDISTSTIIDEQSKQSVKVFSYNTMMKEFEKSLPELAEQLSNAQNACQTKNEEFIKKSMQGRQANASLIETILNRGFETDAIKVMLILKALGIPVLNHVNPELALLLAPVVVEKVVEIKAEKKVANLVVKTANKEEAKSKDKKKDKKKKKQTKKQAEKKVAKQKPTQVQYSGRTVTITTGVATQEKYNKSARIGTAPKTQINTKDKELKTNLGQRDIMKFGDAFTSSQLLE